jgi:hypothetical protein
MPRKYLESDKRKWLELYENGKTEKWIAREVAKCDVRTVKKGVEEARMKQDGIIARRELVKDALHKHQDSLFEEIDRILLALYLPTRDYVVISWQHGGDFILKESEADVSAQAAASRSEEGTVRRLLKKHLKNDKLWKVLAQWEKTYAAHLTARTILQRKTVAVIQEKTGCRMVENSDAPRPFLYSYTTGDLFFRAVLQHAFGDRKSIDLERDITTNPANGEIRYPHLVLGEAPGNEEKTRANLIEAFRELRGSAEAVSVVDTYKTLEEAVMRVRQVVEQIKLFGFIQGQCEICRRLGM